MARPDNLSQRNVYQAAADYRAALLSREQAAVDDTMRRWLVARNQIQTEMDALVRRIEAAEAKGLVPGFGTTSAQYSVSWLYRVGRLDNLAQAIDDQMASYRESGLALVKRRTQTEILEGGRDAKSLLAFRLRDDGLIVARQFAQLPIGALDHITSMSAPGGPIPKAFRQMGSDLVQQVQDRLVTGLAKGENPRVIARKMAADTEAGGILDRPLYEQMRVARTEPLRAYRESSRATYKANADVVVGWEWRAFPSKRTCPFCLAMDGTIHDIDEVFASHPQCRCTSLPVTSLSDTPAFSGAQFLYDANAETQDDILGGHTMGELYRGGKFNLQQLAMQYDSAEWGPSGRVASMKQLREAGVISQLDILVAKASTRTTPDWPFVRPDPKMITLPLLPLPIVRPELPPAPPTPPGPAVPKPKAATRAKKATVPKPEATTPDTFVGRAAAMRAEQTPPDSIDRVRALGAEALTVMEEHLGMSLEGFLNKMGHALIDAKRESAATFDLVREKYAKTLREATARVIKASGREAATLEDIRAVWVGKTAKESAAEVVATFPADWFKTRTRTQIRANLSASRSEYNRLSRALLVDGNHGTTAHELFHTIEQTYPKLVGMERHYYESRTKGEKEVSLRALTGDKDYAAWEMVKKDAWKHPYIGKQYKQMADELGSMAGGGDEHGAFEIGSMFYGAINGAGTTVLMRDRDFVLYMLGMLAGG